jgi:hypothetical protein
MGADLRGRQVVLKRFPWSGAQSCSPLTISLTKRPNRASFSPIRASVQLPGDAQFDSPKGPS